MRGTKSLVDAHADEIQAHILDPENSPLPEKLRPQLDRVMSAARLLDDYPNDSHIIALLQAKYRISQQTCRQDIAIAKQVYKTKHTFDWEFWHMWQIKDQVELVRQARMRNDLKAWNAAKKLLSELIGPKPEALEDPRRMEKNVFNIEVNYNGQQIKMDFSKLQSLPENVRQDILKEFLYKQADDANIEEIMDS